MTGYSKVNNPWHDWPATTTPITAADLDAWDTAIYQLKGVVKNIKDDYGADSTGVTSATTAFQNAFNDCVSAGGGTVFIPAGIFRFDTAPDLSGAAGSPWISVAIVGMGTSDSGVAGNTLIRNYSGTTIFNYASPSSSSYFSGVQIRGLKIVNMVALTNSTTYTIDLQVVAEGFLIEDVIVSLNGLTGSGIRTICQQRAWEMRRVRVASSVSSSGVGFFIGDGTDPAGGYLRSDHYAPESGNGTMTSCFTNGVFRPVHIFGDVDGVGIYGSKLLGNSNTSCIGIYLDGASAIDIGSFHIEGTAIGIFANSNVHSCNIHAGLIQSSVGSAYGIQWDGTKSSGVGVKLTGGVGTMAVGVLCGSNSSGNLFQTHVDGSVTTQYTDNSTNPKTNQFGFIGASAAGAIPYSSGASTFTELAKGTALQQLRMNSGASAPEWFTLGPGTAYTPSITATSSTSVSIGTTGSASGRYIQVGKFVVDWGVITFGGSGIANGSGNYLITLPVACSSSAAALNSFCWGTMAMYDNSANTMYWNTPALLSGTTDRSSFYRMLDSAALTRVSATAPAVTWAASDQFFWLRIYEAA